MTAVPTAHRRCQIAVQVQKESPRQVTLGVGLGAEPDVRQLMAAIEDPPIRIVEMLGEYLARDQRR